ncbi:MAG TPA: efflux RND transporter periplasmic adaptor subunit [Thermoanaerobaculia bacterium]|jgi:cobalt-zinc-cadmium efflux system membrane fusion protein|nr:efflux RND transporter periplasmic adaptor subunit [Thermoanaerobaculia bacterium]
MSAKTWMIRIALLLPLAGCGGGEEMKQEDGHTEETAAGGEEHAGEQVEAGEGMLAVDPEVLRDLKLTTFAAELRPGDEGVTALGELKVNEEAYAEVGAPIPARVVRLIAAPGQAVRRGQALAELRSVELGQARAQQAAARARAELARQTVERKRGLAAERIVSRGELQRAEADAASAEAELRAAEAAVSALGVGVRSEGGDLSTFALLSPLAGTVLERAAVQGQTADPARPLFRVADLSLLWLIVQSPEREAVRVRAGSAAEIALAAIPGRKLRGKVDWIGREVDPHSRTVPVRILVPNEGGTLKPGMFATAWIATGGEGERVVTVPAIALQRMDDRWVVFLPRGEGRFEVRPVERGRDLGSEVAIVSGLRPGERVVDEGAFVLRAEAEKQAGGGEHHHD